MIYARLLKYDMKTFSATTKKTSERQFQPDSSSNLGTSTPVKL